MSESITILGISAFYHDSAAALVRDGVLAAFAREEEISGQRCDPSFPSQAIQTCLKKAGCSLADVDYVVFYEKPRLKFRRLITTYLQYAPLGFASFWAAIPSWVRNKYFMNDLINENLLRAGEVLFVEHHLSHAANAFYSSPFDRAAILTVDNVGEWATASVGEGHERAITIHKELHYPHSVGFFYSAFASYLGQRVNEEEKSLAEIGRGASPRYADLIRERLVDIKPDGSIRLNMDYFDYPAGLGLTNWRLQKLLGFPKRQPQGPLTDHHRELASSIRAVVGDILQKMARHACEAAGCDTLCLSGDLFKDRSLIEPFEHDRDEPKIFLPSFPGDAGSAAGAALFVWYQYLDHARILGPGRRGAV